MDCVVWSPGMSITQLERQVITSAFKHFRHNKVATATSLGIAVRTLEAKLGAYVEMDAADQERDEVVRAERDAFQRRQRGLEHATDLPGCHVTPGGHQGFMGDPVTSNANMPLNAYQKAAAVAAQRMKDAAAGKTVTGPLIDIDSVHSDVKPAIIVESVATEDAVTDDESRAIAASMAAKVGGMAEPVAIDQDGNAAMAATGNTAAAGEEGDLEDLIGGKPVAPTPIAAATPSMPPRNAGNPYGQQRHAQHGKRR